MAPSTTPPPGSSGLSERPSSSLKPGDRLRVRLERPAAQGRTVAHHEGLVLLVSRGIAGEDVEVEIERVYAQHALARVVAVHSASPDRVTPPCPHYERCGGCDLQHMAYGAQLDAKKQALSEQLTRIGGVSHLPSIEIVPSPESLRTRDRLDFLLHAGDDGALHPAFHGVAGGEIVTIEDCRLAPIELTRLAQAIASALSAGRARAERVRVQAFSGHDGRPVLAATIYAGSSSDARALAKRADRWMPRLITDQPDLRHLGVVVAGRQEGGDDSPAEATLLHGEPLLEKHVGIWRYPVPPEAFFQVHSAQAERLVTHVLAEMDAHRIPAGAGIVFDLFCGVGLFSFPLAAEGYRVMGIELGDCAVRAARTAAREMPMGDVSGEFPKARRPEFKVRDLDIKGALEDLAKSLGLPFAVVLDPPRRGLSPHLVRGLLTVRPPVVIYVSCDGATFARDVQRLSEHYRLEQECAFDLFPQTHHLEVVGTFVAR